MLQIVYSHDTTRRHLLSRSVAGASTVNVPRSSHGEPPSGEGEPINANE
jgi:hypothetical protein